jgi:hypothetical protein
MAKLPPDPWLVEPAEISERQQDAGARGLTQRESFLGL